MKSTQLQNRRPSHARASVTALAVAAALTAYGAVVPTQAEAADGAPAAAAPVGPAAVAEVDAARVAAAVAEIKQSGEAYETVVSDGQRYVTLEFGHGSRLYLPDTTTTRTAAASGPGMKTPQYLGGGGGVTKPYVSFNRVDQAALIAGGGAALAGAICLIPAVGQVACVVAGVIVAIATTYLAAYGRCSTSRPNLRIHVYTWQRSSNGCYR
ncbi:hypothetical protein [uncultured Pseudokineococcus sp.]|uniref:hypothetical protein n=1 Tax=uncultured Pseudokineococcus sp. TaxID=1642928 RepID=UPI002616BA71|nr:hypothetical protein [uncultured Pseudokineococcus sp.]